MNFKAAMHPHSIFKGLVFQEMTKIFIKFKGQACTGSGSFEFDKEGSFPQLIPLCQIP